MAYVANPVIERNAIVFIHAYSYKRIRRSILLDVRASFLISLEWVYALSVYFLNLVIRMNCTWCVVHALLGIRLFHKVVTELYLLGLRYSIILFILLASHIDVRRCLNVWKLWLVITVFGASLCIFDRHVRLKISVVLGLDIFLFFIVWHVDLAIKCGFTQYLSTRWAIISFSTISSVLESRLRHHLTVLYWRSYIRLFLGYLRECFLSIHQKLISTGVLSRTFERLDIRINASLVFKINLRSQSILKILTIISISEILWALNA